MRVTKRQFRDMLPILASIAILSPALHAQEQDAPSSTIEEAVTAAHHLHSVEREAKTVDHDLGGFFTKNLEEAKTKSDVGNVLLANGAYTAATAAYHQATQTCQEIVDMDQRAPQLVRALQRYLRILSILKMEPQDDSSIKVTQAAGKWFQSAQEKVAADDMAGAAESIQNAVKAAEDVLIPGSVTGTDATLATVVAAEADILSSRGRIANEDELQDMIDVAGEREGAEQPIVLLLQHARTIAQQAREYKDNDEYEKAVLMFGKTKTVYEQVKTIQDELHSALAARAAMLQERKAAEAACPGEFRPLAFEEAVREQRQADEVFKNADYSNAATRYQQVAETYRKSAEEASIWTELFAAEKHWFDQLSSIDQSLMDQHAAEEFRSLQDESEEVTSLRRANDPIAALKRIKAVMMRLAAINELAQSKERDTQFALALKQARLAVDDGDLRRAQAALTQAARHRPGDPELAAFAEEADLVVLVWSFNKGMDGWKAKGSPTIWHHVFDESAIGGGCLRAGKPGEATYTTNARTTITSPMRINLRFFEKPTLRFRHCVKGETGRDRITVSIGRVAVWSEQSTADWKEVELDLTEVKEKLQESGEIVFSFNSGSSGTGPGAYLDEIELFDATLFN